MMDAFQFLAQPSVGSTLEVRITRICRAVNGTEKVLDLSDLGQVDIYGECHPQGLTSKCEQDAMRGQELSNSLEVAFRN